MICASSRAPKRTRVEAVQPDQRRRRVDRVHHVVERARQRVDVFAVERRHERAVQPLDDLVGEEVALVLDFLDLVGLVPDRADRARASPRAAARRASARRPAPGSRRRTSLRAGSVERPSSPRRDPSSEPEPRIVADPFTRPLHVATRRCTICVIAMPMNNEVLALILGGGQGSRLFPLTQHRSKPAVPIGGKYRLIDIPISNCLHADIRRIFVLTQFNSASLNRHISQTYRMDLFSQGFVEILAAEQTPDNPNWFQGTADAVRQARAPLRALRRRLLPDSRRRPSLPDGLLRAGRRAHRAQRRHHDRRAAGVARRRVGDGHLPVRSQRPDRRASRRSRSASGSTRSARAFRRARRSAATRRTSRSSRRWASTSSRATSCSRCSSRTAPTDFGREIIPAALGRYRVQRVPVPRLLGRRRHRRVVLRRQHHADAARRAVQVLRSAPADLHAPALPARRRGSSDCTVTRRHHRRGLLPRSLHDRGIDRRHPHQHPGAARRSAARCCSAPTTTKPTTTRRRAATSRGSASAATSCSIG